MYVHSLTLEGGFTFIAQIVSVLTEDLILRGEPMIMFCDITNFS